MEGIKEDADENGGGKGKEVLGTIEEEGMTPDTKAKRALNDKKNRRRRRRPKKNINDSIHRSSLGSSSPEWQKALPEDWQDVINL